MKRLLRAWNEGRTEHRDAVKDRVRALTSVSHDVAEISPDELRSRLNGGRSALAGAARTNFDA